MAFEDETTIGGVLAITQLESEPAVFTDSGEGPYVECQETCPEEATGLGVIGTFTAEDGSTSLASAFFDQALGGLRIIAADEDGQLGTELDGETFLGGGIYYGDDGSETAVGVGIVRVPEGASVTAVQGNLERLLTTTHEDALRGVDASELRALQKR